MIDRDAAEKLSSLIGVVGSIMLAIPFFADFHTRRKRVRRLRGFKDGVLDPDDATYLKTPVEGAELEKVLSADSWMAVCSAAGAVFLVVSFLVLLLS